MPEAYLTPAGPGMAEFAEKRSRFIGHIRPVQTEDEAAAHRKEIRAQYHDARHNCWCYILRDGGVRASDDGEPQGTAGGPMLEFLQHEAVFNVSCVVTRYFGGILLGPGGLARAYTRAAKDALTAAGLAQARPWRALSFSCPYPLFDRVRLLLEACGGREEAAEYGAQIAFQVLLPSERAEDFSRSLSELSAGAVSPENRGEVFRILPL